MTLLSSIGFDEMPFYFDWELGRKKLYFYATTKNNSPMNIIARKKIKLLISTLLCSGLTLVANAQWTQLGGDMTGVSDSEFGNKVDFKYAGTVMIGGAGKIHILELVGKVWTPLGVPIS